MLKPHISQKKNSKKRKRAEFEEDEQVNICSKSAIIEQFEYEGDLEEYYTGDGQQKRIKLEELEEFGSDEPLYVCLDTKEMMNMLDLKKEVILTMLNQLEQV